jgi:hypothetical protein
VLCVQPDNGTICVYWVPALISVLQPAAASGAEYRLAALQALCTAVYRHTGHVVPRSQASIEGCATLRACGLVSSRERVSAEARSAGKTFSHRRWRIRC